MADYESIDEKSRIKVLCPYCNKNHVFFRKDSKVNATKCICGATVNRPK